MRVRAGYTKLLQSKYAHCGSTKDEINQAILKSPHARDFGLNRRDISNINVHVAWGTFRYADNDAQSVYARVRSHV